ncbi:unnamed protein product [Adineta ricciae]|uniref:Uncharacterized protein n=1 Tax=Adineta ricciae TaxID=249248 RepID=A0A815ANF1_ADIRI|nr:unnamed protein product [Adineta ricciae]
MSKEKSFDESDFSSIVGKSLRNVLEKSVTDLVLPYKILSLSHLSSWNTFENDIIQLLKQNPLNEQEFLLFNHLNFSVKENFQEEDISFKYLMNYQVDFLHKQSDFDRLRRFIFYLKE